MQVAKPKKGYKLVKTLFGKYEEIPEEWEVKKVNDIIDFHGGFAFKGNEFSKKGKFVVRTLNIQKNGSISHKNGVFIPQEKCEQYKKYELKENDTIFVMVGLVGKMGYVSKDVLPALLNQNMWLLRPSKVNPKFFYYSFLINSRSLLRTAHGSTRNFALREDCKEILIPFPPLPEQKQIVSILSNVDDTLQKTNQIIEQTRRLKNGMMQKLLTRGIGHTKFKKTKIGEIPETWDLVRVEDIIKTKGDVRTGPFGSHLLNHELVDRGIRVIYPEDIVNHTISDSVKKCITSEKYQKLKRYSVKSRDIVISLMGTIGQIGLVNEDVGKAIISKHILKISLDPKKFYPEFFCRLFDFTPINNQLHALSQGQIMKGLNTKIIKEIKLPAPKLNEQKQIASILSNVDTQIQKEKLHKSNLERLKKGLMQKLLTGQIRVKVR